MTGLRRLVAAGVVAAALMGCSGDDSATSTTTTPANSALPETSTSAATETDACLAPEPDLVRSELDLTVRVFVFCGDGVHPVDLRPVARVVPDDGAPLRAAINQLLLGVTPEEAAAGLRSAFSSSTAAQLRGLTLDGGIATLDFTSGFATTNNFSTSSLSAVVYSQLDATVFQFDEITGLEFQIEGERWCGWENTCDDVPIPFRERP